MKKNCNLFIGFMLAVTSLMAQPALAQNPATVKAAEFTDAQILDLLSQAQAAGLGVEQAEKLAIAKGMPASEAQAFKDRLNKVQAKAPSNAATPALASEETAEAKGKQALVEAATPITGSEIVAPKADKPVTVYGQELFRKGDIKIYERSIDAKAPANYELGVGDELGISIFGVSYYNTVAKVDSRGRIELGQLGSIYVKGVPFDRAKILIKTALSNHFNMSSNQVEISLAYSRSITVNIVGEVFKPGSYKIPALNTAFNALIAAGGPTDIGTLRNIQLRRNGKVIKTFDVYTYLQNPGSDDDFFLQDNDYLVIGTVGKLVSIAGAVKRPMTYELLPGEQLAKLINYAGDLNANSMGRSMVLQRYIDKNLSLFPLNWDSLTALKTDYILVDGDQVTIKCAEVDLACVGSDTAVHNAAAHLDGDFFRGLGIVLPQLRTGPGIVGVNLAPGGGYIDHTIDIERGALLRQVGVVIGKPRQAQTAYRIAIDFVQRAVMALFIGTTHCHPLRRLRSRIRQTLTGYIGSRCRIGHSCGGTSISSRRRPFRRLTAYKHRQRQGGDSKKTVTHRDTPLEEGSSYLTVL